MSPEQIGKLKWQLGEAAAGAVLAAGRIEEAERLHWRASQSLRAWAAVHADTLAELHAAGATEAAALPEEVQARLRKEGGGQ